jgi:antitoxin (DNA-binding transcriptional repressor) of toxin-antitoxin stability system
MRSIIVSLFAAIISLWLSLFLFLFVFNYIQYPKIKAGQDVLVCRGGNFVARGITIESAKIKDGLLIINFDSDIDREQKQLEQNERRRMKVENTNFWSRSKHDY